MEPYLFCQIALVGLSSDVTLLAFYGYYRKKRTRLIADVTPSLKHEKAEGMLRNLNGKEVV